MATKSVINANMPQTRGISIVIEQDQSQRMRQQQQQQQLQLVHCKQQQQLELDTGKLSIFQSTRTHTSQTPTATTEPAPATTTATTTTVVRGDVATLLQQVSSKYSTTSTASATAKTLIDINRNSVDDQINVANAVVADDNSDGVGVAIGVVGQQEIAKETGCTTATFPHLRLRVASAPDSNTATTITAARAGSASERGKASDEMNSAVGKSPATLRRAAVLESAVGVSITHGRGERNDNDNGSGSGSGVSVGAGADNDIMAIANEIQIIQCNSRNSSEVVARFGQADAEAHADDDEDEHAQQLAAEESRQRCNGVSVGSVGISGFADLASNAENGQVSCAGVCGAYGTERLENDSAALSADSRTSKADCASALTETLKDSAQPNTHIVKIQIQPSQVPEPETTANPVRTSEKQVTVVRLSEKCAIVPDRSAVPVDLATLNMVQNSGGASAATNPQSAGNISSGSTTVTELNVSNSPYLYYVMSSGQFSPCDTLDSGTGSDLESNGHNANGASSPKVGGGSSSNGAAGSSATSGGAPKLEMHLKTTKIRVNNPSKCADKQNNCNSDHQRAGSLTDSEESEASSLSCDSLHSAEYMRHCSASPTSKTNPGEANSKMLSSLLPDSLLRDIRDRKFPTNDFESKYGRPSLTESVSEPEYVELQQSVEHAKFVNQLNSSNSVVSKRTSMPNKTFVLNAADGTFVDTKMNSMPRKYEADKYYNFHVNEHENFRSFGSGSVGSADDTVSLSEYDTKSMHDEDAFAGYKDIRCGSSATSTIRSSKGTVRGVKNRVRNGIATFLQLQQPHVKNYLEKDLGKVVLYTTSMGIIRDTYAKCANMKQILRTLLVKFEERDVFMSVEYQQEIKERMHSEAIKVPQLFVEGQHIGDAETVERLNESGELRQLLKPYKSIASTYTCQTCGGYRLLPCPSCNGSKKSVHRNHFTAEFVALKCMNCDEVGLVKCHNC